MRTVPDCRGRCGLPVIFIGSWLGACGCSKCPLGSLISGFTGVTSGPEPDGGVRFGLKAKGERKEGLRDHRWSIFLVKTPSQCSLVVGSVLSGVLLIAVKQIVCILKDRFIYLAISKFKRHRREYTKTSPSSPSSEVTIVVFGILQKCFMRI